MSRDIIFVLMYHNHELLEPVQVSRAFDTVLYLITSFMYFNYTRNGGTQRPVT
jgi:hypothetical protein